MLADVPQAASQSVLKCSLSIPDVGLMLARNGLVEFVVM